MVCITEDSPIITISISFCGWKCSSMLTNLCFSNHRYLKKVRSSKQDTFGDSACSFDIYLFIFDSIWTIQAVYRNLWYIKSPLWKVICFLLGWFVISAQLGKKWPILTPQYKRISNKRSISKAYVKMSIRCCSCRGRVVLLKVVPLCQCIITQQSVQEQDAAFTSLHITQR
jgi:hypothetical protein